MAVRKKGGNRVSSHCLRPLRRLVDRCTLIDMGYVGTPYTWTNMRTSLANIQECLDRALCNQAWQDVFVHMMVQHLPRVKSNHAPLFITTVQRPTRQRDYPFRILTAWYQHNQFPELVQNGWGAQPEEAILVKQRRFSQLAGYWNRHVFGNIFWTKKTLLARLEGIQRMLAERFSPYLSNLQGQPRLELEQVLLYEESLWR